MNRGLAQNCGERRFRQVDAIHEKGDCCLQHTEHYNLNQWELSDRILHTDFNRDNAILDTALWQLGQRGIVKLKEIVTTASVQQIDLDVTDIDWDSYRWIEICAEAIGTTAPNGIIRLNGLSGGTDYYYTNTSTYSTNNYLCPFYNVYSSDKVWTRLVLFGRSSKVTGYCEQIGTSYADWHFMCANASLRLSNLATVNFISSASLLAGSTITIYGVTK